MQYACGIPQVADTPFNPLDRLNLGESVAGALLKQAVGPLPPGNRFEGAGIYAIYYIGDFKSYSAIANQNRDGRFDRPIYVGKAVPKGARKGGFGLGATKEPALFKRLKEHAKSIQATKDLKVDDFFCRYLVADDIWIPLGESLLIEWFQPLWNVLLAGFGIHAPGKGRQKQVCSSWDTVHPGRKFAAKLPPNQKTATELLKLVADLLAGKAVETISPKEAVTEEGEE
jgi:hypothetical protein